MNFCSDNIGGASPEILAALVAVNSGSVMPYGEDEYTVNAIGMLRELFECDAEILFTGTGSSANALALATLTPPYGTIYCHPDSHVNVDECGAPEFFTGGAKLMPVLGENGKITVDGLEEAMTGLGVVHHTQPATVSISQVTEAGTVYSLPELRAIAEFCQRNDLKLHMDGARFANAVVALSCSPAECSHAVGVDVLSFGATKNGALSAEAVVYFDKELAVDAGFRRKRAGHLFSKMRFLSSQFEAYIKDDLWRKNAKHANAMAAHLGEGLQKLECVRFEYPVQANEIFVHMPIPLIERLFGEGFLFYRWKPNGTLVRFVTAFNTDLCDVEALLSVASCYQTSHSL